MVKISHNRRILSHKIGKKSKLGDKILRLGNIFTNFDYKSRDNFTNLADDNFYPRES